MSSTTKGTTESPGATKAARPRFTRRRFLKSLGCLGVLAAAPYVHARWIEPRWVEFVRHDLRTPRLPSEMNGCTVAQISDVHIGPDVDANFVVETLGKLNELGPDLVVITGDMMTCHGREQIRPALSVFRRLRIPPLGAYLIMGNHDYGAGWSRPEVADELAEGARQIGITVLRNDVVNVRGLKLIGLDDLWASRFAPAQVMTQLKEEDAAMALCHNPDAADMVEAWGRFRGPILAGHTHGGQCKPPFLPPPMLPVVNRRYTAGLFDLGDGRTMYINRGLGNLNSVRFNVRPEVTLHRLVG